MIVSAWSDGRGFVYGLRILGSGRSLYFREEWESIALFFPDTAEPATIRITPCFWRNCPELRGKTIRAFFQRNGLIPWPRGHPPHFDLQPLGGGRFRLEWLEHRPIQPTLGLFDGVDLARDAPSSRKEDVETADDGGTLVEGEQGQ